MSSSRVRLLGSLIVSAALVVPVAWMWQASLVPSTFSVMEMGYVDHGGSSPAKVHAHEAAVSVPDLVVDPDTPADVRFELVADQGTVTLASGRTVEGYTLNGSSPGPLIEATQGDLVEVMIRNASVRAGITLHWHGIDVPNAEDGVAGVTQDAIGVGEEHTYRFVAEDAGTYWYHSHQVSHAQVVGGLLGPVLIHPTERDPDLADHIALTHLYAGQRTINGLDGDVRAVAEPGQRARIRVINTDNGPVEVWSSHQYRLVAVDGQDVNEPTEVTDLAVTVTAGGRADLEFVVPDDGSAVRIEVGGSTSMLVGPSAAAAPDLPQPTKHVDLLSYGTPAPIGFDADTADREFDYNIGRRPGFVDGTPGLWWSINGKLYPDVPMYVVQEGDVAVMRIRNNSGDVHPMHLHGHHAVVLSRDGVRATGSPWWVDSLNVLDGEQYEIAFLADNPGVWMDHCHNLKHAAEGLVAHLMYDTVSTPYVVGGPGKNEPE